MNRKKFIKITGISSLGILLGFDAFKKASKSIFEIDNPIIHCRHGLFNLNQKNSNTLTIRRDIMTANGFDSISTDRMTSIKVTNQNDQKFATLSNDKLLSDSSKFRSILLEENQSTQLEVKPNQIIFSEFDSYAIDKTSFHKNQAILINEKHTLKAKSSVSQHLIIYQV